MKCVVCPSVFHPSFPKACAHAKLMDGVLYCWEKSVCADDASGVGDVFNSDSMPKVFTYITKRMPLLKNCETTFKF